MATVAAQIAGFLGEFEGPVARLVRAARRELRRRFPGAVELVYDNYNFLVFGFCTTERASDAMVSLAAHARGVSLCFYRGADLPDPERLLQGEGKQNRYVRLVSAEALREPGIEALLGEAERRAKVPLKVGVRGTTVVRSISPKRRPRKPAPKRAAVRAKRRAKGA